MEESVKREAAKILTDLRGPLERALERARSIRKKDGSRISDLELEFGASTVPMVEVWEHMGDLLFYWPPFWKRLERWAATARSPRGPRDLSSYVRELRTNGWSEIGAQNQARRESGPRRIEVSDRARDQIDALFSELVRRRGGWKKRIHYDTFFDEWKKQPARARSKWVMEKANKTGLSEASVRRYVGKGRELREGNTHRRGRKRKTATPTE